MKPDRDVQKKDKEKSRVILRVDNLWKTYEGSETPAVKGLGFSVFEGEIFGLLGPNGAGKTTAISIMTTLLAPDKGEISIDGIEACRYPGRVKRVISLAPQEIALYPVLTIRENLRFFGSLQKIPGRRLNEKIDECLDFTGLLENADKRVETCSGGMKRRANLAAALLNDPRILFLDEPTVGIDTQSRNMILEKLKVLGRKGVTMIYTSHYLEEAEALCFRVGIMDGGEMIVSGVPGELIKAYPACKNLGDLFLHLTGRQLRD